MNYFLGIVSVGVLILLAVAIGEDVERNVQENRRCKEAGGTRISVSYGYACVRLERV